MTPSPDIALSAAGARVQMVPPKMNGHGPAPARLPRPLVLLDPRVWTTPAPAREWIVRDWIPAGVVTALYGDGGVGKTLLAQQLLTSTALGLPWLDLETAQGRALGVFCEDDDAELQRRQQAINAALGVEPAALRDLRLLSRLGQDNVLMDFTRSDTGELTAFFDDLDATLRAFRPGLVALDTAADLFGGNENVRPQVRRFIGACLGRLAIEHRCAVLLLAHPSRSGLSDGTGTGGSTAWNNTVRSRLYLKRSVGEGVPADTNLRTLSREKANYAAKGEEVTVEWRGGAFRVAQAGAMGMDDPATWQAVGAMFDEIERAWTSGNPWSPAAQTRESGRYFPTWARARLGVPEKRTKALLTDWMANGCLANEQVDTDTKKRGLKVLRRPDQ